MAKYNLSDAAKSILEEGSKETFDANIAAKRSQRELTNPSKVGISKLPSTIAYGTHEAGLVGQSPEKSTEELPDYLKGVPSATPPGATPPVGSEKDGVGASRPKNQPQETMGRTDIMHPVKKDATDYESIRDRKPYSAPNQTFTMNKNANFQSYGEGVDMSADVDALLEGESLSEEFKQKATTIFEAAVTSRLQSITEEIENQLTEQFEVAVDQIKEDLANKVDDYLNYMVKEWMEENELAIDNGLRAEISEDFIKGLHNLFSEHYIDVPEEKVDVVEELAARVEELEETLNEQINRGIQLNKELNEQKKLEAIHTACEGLTQTQVEKLKTLAENVEFTTEDEFVTKVETLKESYFRSDVRVANKTSLDDEVLIEEDRKDIKSSSSDIDIYVKAISQTVAK